MIDDIKRLLEENKVTSLRGLSDKIKVPYTKLKNISSLDIRKKELFTKVP